MAKKIAVSTSGSNGERPAGGGGASGGSGGSGFGPFTVGGGGSGGGARSGSAAVSFELFDAVSSDLYRRNQDIKNEVHSTYEKVEAYQKQAIELDIQSKKIIAAIEAGKVEAEESSKRAKVIQEDIKRLEESIRSTEIKSIEVIGVFSSVIALLLVFVQTAIQSRSLAEAYPIMLLTTCSLILFAALIHNFFHKEKKQISYWIFFVGIPLFLISAFGVYALSHDSTLSSQESCEKVDDINNPVLQRCMQRAIKIAQ